MQKALSCMPLIVAMVAALFLSSGRVSAGTEPATADSLEVSINAGDQGWATFIFGHPIDGTPGTTVLVIQCGFDRAELITNYDVYGQQMGSQFFAVTCTQNGPSFVNGERVISYTLNATPLFESLVMRGRDSNGNTVIKDLKLTINSASWTVEGYGRGAKDTGRAQIVY